jgi:hypothetical protein
MRTDTGWLVATVNKVKTGVMAVEYDYRDVGRCRGRPIQQLGLHWRRHRQQAALRVHLPVGEQRGDGLTCTTTSSGRGDDVDYDRVQADLLVKF